MTSVRGNIYARAWTFPCIFFKTSNNTKPLLQHAKFSTRTRRGLLPQYLQPACTFPSSYHNHNHNTQSRALHPRARQYLPDLPDLTDSQKTVRTAITKICQNFPDS